MVFKSDYVAILDAGKYQCYKSKLVSIEWACFIIFMLIPYLLICYLCIMDYRMFFFFCCITFNLSILDIS